MKRSTQLPEDGVGVGPSCVLSNRLSHCPPAELKIRETSWNGHPFPLAIIASKYTAYVSSLGKTGVLP
jgi:hypothetical protein